MISQKPFNLTNRHIAGIFTALLITIILFVYFDFLTFKKLFLFKDIGSDTINISLPYFIHLSEYIRNTGIPMWSFSQGMGQNIFPFSLGDPFVLTLLLLGKTYLPFGIVYMEALKILLGGLLFFFYLKEAGMHGVTCVIFGLIFSFSGYMILGGCWYQFSTEAVYCALLLLSLEIFINRQSWILIALAAALIGAYQPFNLFIYGVFAFVYYSAKNIVSKDYTYRKVCKGLFRICGAYLLGIGIISVFLFSNMHEYIQSPRVGGDASYSGFLLSSTIFHPDSFGSVLTAVSRFFSNDLLGTGSYFSGTKNYLEAPILYGGLLSLLIFPQLFIFLKGRQRIIFICLVLLLIISMIFPFFRYAFWLFIGDYYRTFSFFITIIMLICGAYALDHIIRKNRLNYPLFCGSFIFLICVLYSLGYFKKFSVDESQILLVSVFLFYYFTIISLYVFSSFKKTAVMLLLVTVCFELGAFAYITTNDRLVLTADEYSSKAGYNDYTNEAVSFLNAVDKSFYRINKNYSSGPALHSSLNDAKIQDYFGSSSYHTFNQIYYIRFLSALDIVDGSNEPQTKWAPGLTRPLLATLGNVKYFLSKGNRSNITELGYKKTGQFNNVSVYRNIFYLPLGITFTSYISDKDFLDLPSDQKDIALLNGFVVSDSQAEIYTDFTKMNDDTYKTFDLNRYYSIINRLRKGALHIDLHSQNYVSGSINAKEKCMLLFTIPFDNGWKILVDGENTQAEVVDFGFTGVKLKKGYHEIVLMYRPPLVIGGLIVSLFSIIIFAVLRSSKSKKIPGTGIYTLI